MNNNSSKQIILSVIGVAILVIAVVGVSFAFFSYFGNASNNTFRTGQITFNATASDFDLTNAFPTTAAGAATSTVQIQGNTTYANGIDFDVKVVSVSNNTGSILPTISVAAAGSLPTGVTVTPNTVTAGGLVTGTVLATGHITSAATMNALTDVLTIKAYYDKNLYHITNLEHSTDNINQLKTAGLLDNAFNGTLVSQEAWNALAAAPFTFSIRVTAVEGTGA